MRVNQIVLNHLEEKKGSLKDWFLATRPKTLLISFPPLFLGTLLAKQQVDQLNWLLVISIFLSVPWIQIGMNLTDDAFYIKKWGANVTKLGLHRKNLLTGRQFLFGGYACFFLTLLFGMPLVIAGGWPFFLLLLFSIALGYFYSGGPFPLSYTGTSECLILLFYGWVSIAATYYLQTGEISPKCLLAGTQIGLLAIVPHAINNLRDYQADTLINKKTLAVRFGIRFSRWEISLCSFIPYFLGMFWFRENQIGMATLPFFSLPLVIYNMRSIWQVEPSPLYNEFLAKSVLSHFFFGILLGVASFLT